MDTQTTEHRHKKGTGSLALRKDGRWEGRIQLNGQRTTVYGATQQEADDKLQKLIARLRLAPPPKPGTLARYLTEWLASHDVAPATYRQYRTIIHKHLISGLGNVRLIELTPIQVRIFLAQLREAGLGARTRQQCHQVLHAALKDAWRDELVPRNVCDQVRQPKYTAGERPFLTADQVAALTNSRHDASYGPLWTVAVGTGLRRGELLGLRWQDVDFAQRQIRVVGTLDGRGGERKGPKTPRSKRVVPLPPQAVDALHIQRRAQLEQRLKSGANWQPTDLVFTTGRGTPLTATMVYRAWNKDLTRLQLPAIALHSLRHTCTSLLAAKGVPLSVIRDILGHNSSATTFDIYTHVASQEKIEAMAILGQALGA